MPLEKDIPFIKGRRVGPDAIVSRDEQWAARSREAHPPREEWYVSTLPPHMNNAVSESAPMIEELVIAPLAQIPGILDATSARLRVSTRGIGEKLRVCLYRYEDSRTLRKKALRKVPNSDAIFDLSLDTTAGAPLDVALNGVATVLPGRQYFVGFRCTSTSARIPCASVDDVGHYACYVHEGYPDAVPPVNLAASDLQKTYEARVPWITYVSTNAQAWDNVMPYFAQLV